MPNATDSRLAFCSPASRRMAGMVLAAAAMTSSANAQELVWQVDGTSSEQIGAALATLADIDGDGVQEVIAGAPTGNLVRVLSGASGALLWEWDHTPPSQEFGIAISDAGDVNGDGVADVIVGAKGLFSSETGNAYVYSGADGSNLYSLAGTHVGDEFGAAVLGLGDVDGDGLGDFAIGAPTVPIFSSGYDRVEVRSGATGGILHAIPPIAFGDNIGCALALLDDLDGDGSRDFATGALIGRYFEVVSSKSGSILLTIHGSPPAADFFGESLAAIGDLDGDGFGDLLVGSPLRDNGAMRAAGTAEAFSTGSGTLLQKHPGFTANYEVGISVASAGDSNGDGVVDLLVGSEAGFASLYSGASGRLLYRFKAALGTLNGLGVAGGADFDGDAFADVVLGDPDRGALHPGHVEVRRGNDLYLDSEPFGPTAGASFSLTLGEGTPGNLSLIALTGVNGVPIFMALVVAPLDANGQLALKGSVPSGLAGTSADFLGLAIAAGGKVGVSAIETVSFQ